MIGKKAPRFSCQAAIQDSIKDEVCLENYDGKYKVIFFYPQDFTFVCPTELHAFQDKLSEFEKRNVQVIGCSVDSPLTHAKWLKTPKMQGGIQGITYPLLADTSKQMCRDYGVLDEQSGVAFRGVFILDKDNVVQSLTINNMSLGRNIDEILRIIDALQFAENHGQVCPANWNNGDKAMDANEEGVRAYFKE
jgi:peroxiredoxin (alkyl hydroperoxide reductase subunit C)